MGKMKFENNEKGHFFKRKGLYFSLAVCMLALGAGTWSAINRNNPPAVNEPEYTTEAPYSVKDVEKKQPQVVAPTTVKQTKKQTSAATSKKISTVAEYFILPVGGQITKSFNDKELQYSETYNDWRIHLGTDIAAEKGTQVHSAGNGKVTDVIEDALLGNTVIIDHGNNITAYYSGLNSSLVKKGQTVEMGDVIGGIGDVPSETVESTHIHFAVKQNNKWADPIKTMKIEIS